MLIFVSPSSGAMSLSKRHSRYRFGSATSRISSVALTEGCEQLRRNGRRGGMGSGTPSPHWEVSGATTKSAETPSPTCQHGRSTTSRSSTPAAICNQPPPTRPTDLFANIRNQVPQLIFLLSRGVASYPVRHARTENLCQKSMIGCLLPGARRFQISNFYFRGPFQPTYTIWSRSRNPQAADRVGLIREHKYARSLRTIREPFRRVIILREPNVGADSLVIVVDRVLPRERNSPLQANCVASCSIEVLRRTDRRQAQYTEPKQQCT